MRTSIGAVTALAGSLLLAPLMWGPSQAASAPDLKSAMSAIHDGAITLVRGGGGGGHGGGGWGGHMGGGWGGHMGGPRFAGHMGGPRFAGPRMGASRVVWHKGGNWNHFHNGHFNNRHFVHNRNFHNRRFNNFFFVGGGPWWWGDNSCWLWTPRGWVWTCY
jgi:hypothetical protein